MAELVAGQRRAFDTLFAALWPPAARYAQHLLGDASSAEDVAQRALIRLFEEAHTYRPGSSVLAWALSLTYWEARTERKRRSRAKTETWTDQGALDETPNALTQLVDDEARRELTALIDTLASDERALLGLGEPQLIAHVAPSTVRKRRQRLLARLKRAVLDLALARNDHP
jgi:RNA polymerase sigma-70 factor (ECF subfamily)